MNAASLPDSSVSGPWWVYRSNLPWLGSPGTSSHDGQRMSLSDPAWATSYVPLSLVLSLPHSSAHTLDLRCSLILIPSLALSPPAPNSTTRMDPRSFSLFAVLDLLAALPASCRGCRAWSERALPELGLCSASALATLVGQVHLPNAILSLLFWAGPASLLKFQIWEMVAK